MTDRKYDDKFFELVDMASDFIDAVEDELINDETRSLVDAAARKDLEKNGEDSLFSRTARCLERSVALMKSGDIIWGLNQFEYAELRVQFLSAVFSEDKVAKFLPEELHNEESAKFFEERSRTNLAALCRRNL